MKEEIYKTLEKVSLYADVEISNFGDVCAISRSKKPCIVSKNAKGKHFLKIWKVNHWKAFLVESELCKLFPEEKENYTKDYLYRTKVRDDEKKIIKKDNADGYSVGQISKAYKIREETIYKIVSAPNAGEPPIILVEY